MEDAIDAFYQMPIIAPLVLVGLAVALLTAPAWVPRLGPASVIALAAFAVVGLLIARRLRTLRRLCEAGDEVEGSLVNVDNDHGETDFRTATYQYEYSGKPHSLRITGTDFFVGRATRHGEHVLLLVDPTRPEVARIVRTLHFGQPSKFEAPRLSKRG